jgi:hypothetical protein
VETYDRIPDPLVEIVKAKAVDLDIVRLERVPRET